MKAANLFDNIPKDIPQEIFQDLLKTENLRIERVISKGQSSPESGWYDQTENEWVVVLQGHAKLRFEKDDQLIELTSGMYVDIKAGTKHKVQWTTPDQETIWLAIFY
jgi:cupin 2 domain-containing protein